MAEENMHVCGVPMGCTLRWPEVNAHPGIYHRAFNTHNF